MYDLHQHLPFSVSDGPEKIEDSKEILKMAADSGIVYINAVAHYKAGIIDEVSQRVECLTDYAKELGIELHPGVEYSFAAVGDDDFTKIFVAPRSSYVLVDFENNFIPDFAIQRFSRLALNGVRPIVVHPEVLFSRKHVKKMIEMADLNIEFQINASSFLPENGSEGKNLALLLIQAGIAKLIATDAHRPSGHRRISMAEAKKVIGNKFGSDVVNMMFEVNPKRIAENKESIPLPVKPLSWLQRKILGL